MAFKTNETLTTGNNLYARPSNTSNFVKFQFTMNALVSRTLSKIDAKKHDSYCAGFGLKNGQGEVKIEKLEKLRNQTSRQPACRTGEAVSTPARAPSPFANATR